MSGMADCSGERVGEEARQMSRSLGNLFALIVWSALWGAEAAMAAASLLDDFESLAGWSLVTSPGIRAEIARDAGHAGMGLRIDFDFRGEGGYVIVRKDFSLPLPENYAFSFCVRGQAPDNPLEFKLVDATGNNVWWRRQRDLPAEWRRMVIRKKHLDFAWGPAAGGFPAGLGALEIAITAGAGGKGSVWIDDLQWEEREPETPYTLTPQVQASTSAPGHEPERVLDPAPGAGWRSGVLSDSQWLTLDFLRNREYGGLVIDWEPQDYAVAYEVQLSEDGQDWRTVYTVVTGNGRRDYIPLPDAESRYLRLALRKSRRGQGYGILALDVRPAAFAESPQQLFAAMAQDGPRGLYPKYAYGEQTYWTVVGVDGGGRQGLFNEEGMLEVDKGGFSIEPFLVVDGDLVDWGRVNPVLELEQDYLPMPSVTWRYGDLLLKITAFATGAPGAAVLYARYQVVNNGQERRPVNLFLTLRPFQVNPPTQTLNMVGGLARIHTLDYEGRTVQVNQEKSVLALTPPHRFGAVDFDGGPITDYLLENRLPAETRVSDLQGYASGALQYELDLPPGAMQEVTLAIPFHGTGPAELKALSAEDAPAFAQRQFETAVRDWETRLNRVELDLPATAAPVLNTLRSALAHILINRDGPAIQPGPRSYARSWIRDGVLSAAALLALGHTEEARDFLHWYARYQFPDGQTPCCVDQRGADPVPENDSHGEFIYGVMEYYRYTRDVGFLAELWPAVVKAVEYIDFLRRQRLTPTYRTPDLLPFYGLLPESISHEGYAKRPVHSYWDDFFTLRGLKDAAAMAAVVGDARRAAEFSGRRDQFRQSLYASIARTMARHGIGYIPGSVELGDFDPTATAIAVTPGGEQHNLAPEPLRRTFADYFEYFLGRQYGDIFWEAYTPYEVRIVGALVRLGQRQPALDVLDFFLAARRPPVWNQWPEIVWRDAKTARFIGDMPHAWVGSEYIRSVLSLFAYEDEGKQALVIGAGLPREWVESESGVAVRRLPTCYGPLNYRLRLQGPGELRLDLSGDLALPLGKVVVKPPVTLVGVTINGRPGVSFDGDSAVIDEFPAEVMLRYRP